MANEKRLISYDVLIAHLDSCIEQGKGMFKSVCVAIKCFVTQMPTVDAVEVVRCKDCMWFDCEDELTDVFRSEQHCYCTEANTYVPINHFCSYGERRSDA